MGRSMFDDIVEGVIVAKHVFRGATKAYAKAKQVAESEKGQQIRRELREKANEAIGLASEKAREMGLEEKTRSVFELAKDYAKEMVLNTSGSLEPDITLAQIVPGSCAERISELKRRAEEETEKHDRIIGELRRELKDAPEYVEADENGLFPEVTTVTADVIRQKIQEEEERFAALCYSMQEELDLLRDEEQDMILTLAEQRRMEEIEEEKRRREENRRDWDILMGKDPDRFW